MYSHLKSGGGAKEHHCVENWPSKGVEVRTRSKFKNNLSFLFYCIEKTGLYNRTQAVRLAKQSFSSNFPTQ